MRSAALLALLMLAACASAPPPLPPDLLASIDAEMLALPPEAEDLFFMEDSERLARLRASGRGTHEDREFLEKRIIGEQIPRVYADLARRARPAPAPPLPDIPSLVIFKDGRRIVATIVEMNDRTLRLNVRLGLMRIQREDVLRVEPAPK